MVDQEYGLYDIVEMKKEHPCHKSKYWRVIRVGADIKIKCEGCGAVVMFPRHEFERKLRKVIEHVTREETEA
ncbi:MAG: DUF951 domain-containing protein [Solobacterium sp.]|nr:DUF951 domain-containing protein [Solobacterium sp.]MBR2830047.1 DUF951 domain-containing protein [Solobacterium sp.]MBR3128339.1 DUF951 domain-containing protein [Solobacterium sp.]